MKVLSVFLLVIMVFSSCTDDHEEPSPTTTGSYSGTFTGYVSPTFVSGNCKGDFVEKDSKISGVCVFSPNVFNGFAATSLSFPVTATLKMEGDSIYGINGTISIGMGIGDVPLAGTVSKDKKTIKMSCNPAIVFNLKWTLIKD